MSEGNGDGVLKVVHADGVRRIQVGRGEPQDIDIVRAYNRWMEIAGQTPEGRTSADQCSAFVKELDLGDQHNLAEAVAFTVVLTKEADALKKSIGLDVSSPDATASTASA